MHIDYWIHFIRELVATETIRVEYVPSEENDANIFTKLLGSIVREKLMKRLGLRGDIEEKSRKRMMAPGVK